MFGSAAESKSYIPIIFYLDSGAPDFAEVSKFCTGLRRLGLVWTGLNRFRLFWTDFGVIWVGFDLHAQNYENQTDLNESFRMVVSRRSCDEILS